VELPQYVSPDAARADGTAGSLGAGTVVAVSAALGRDPKRTIATIVARLEVRARSAG